MRMQLVKIYLKDIVFCMPWENQLTLKLLCNGLYTVSQWKNVSFSSNFIKVHAVIRSIKGEQTHVHSRNWKKIDFYCCGFLNSEVLTANSPNIVDWGDLALGH